MKILVSTHGIIIGIGLLVLQQLSGINGILLYSSYIFKAAGVSSSNVASCGLGAVQVIATGVTTWLVDKAGRRLLLILLEGRKLDLLKNLAESSLIHLLKIHANSFLLLFSL